jgi:hypothetical protein
MKGIRMHTQAGLELLACEVSGSDRYTQVQHFSDNFVPTSNRKQNPRRPFRAVGSPAQIVSPTRTSMRRRHTIGSG